MENQCATMMGSNSPTSIIYRQKKDVEGLKTPEGKQIYVLEFCPEDFYLCFEAVNNLIEKNDQTLIEQFKVLSRLAIVDILPNITNLEQKFWRELGFSWQRKIWETFLEVNQDFLWGLGKAKLNRLLDKLKMMIAQGVAGWEEKIVSAINQEFNASTTQPKSIEASEN